MVRILNNKNMISFIVIGRNEGDNLRGNFDSIGLIYEKYVKFEFECIYVDSDSIDNSVQIAKNHPSVNKVIKLTGKYNSAIARNVGAYYSAGETLFFVDGDMILDPDFLSVALDLDTGNLIYPIVTGDLINITNGVKSYYYGAKLEEDKYDSKTGGIFIIERKLWVEQNGMDIRFKRSQDLDFFFNLSLKGIMVLRKKELICFHNTDPYHSKKRIKSAIYNKYSLYTGLLYRKYILKSHRIMPIIFRRDYTSVLLLFAMLIPILYNSLFYTIIIYFMFIVVRGLLSEKNINPNYLFYRIISDFYVLTGFLFFYPKRAKTFKLVVLK